MKNARGTMNQHYRVALRYDADGYWVAEHPELPGCVADGAASQEALASLNVARELWIESRVAAGLAVPEPQDEPQYSGRFVVRIAKSLHRELAGEAEAEGVSLNSLIAGILAGRNRRKESVAGKDESRRVA
ncbi:MAG: toxin-antitoxin system HicB family antitoxin [Terracidiphilus sp.]